MSSFKLTEITFDRLQQEVNYYLQTVYNKASQLFSVASPFGQVLTVFEELHQLSLLYLKRSVDQFNLSDPNSNNYDIVRSAAIVAGHNPARAVSASGTLRCRINPSVDVTSDIPGGKVKILNKTTIKNNTNNLLYHIDLGGSDEQVFDVTSGKSIFVNIAQGEWKQSTFTGTGDINQSFELESDGKEIENYKIEVRVNGEYWAVKNHLYEMIPNENAVVIRTSFNGGIDIIFGNGNYGNIPPINSVITVDYVETDGSNGNIYRRTSNDWKFIDDVLSTNGSTIEFERNFSIFIETDINFGADSEDISLMKNLLPLNTNNFILALPEQYSYAIKRLGVFSHVNAYDDNGVIKIVATPNIRIFKNRNSDYFTVDKRAFELDEYEREKLDQYLRAGGFIQLTSKYQINTPDLSYYVMYITLRLFDDAIEENVNSQIVDLVSEYFLDLNRMDRIPRKDLINVISKVNGVDSVDVRFVSKKNEDYHRKYKGTPQYQENRSIGIDNNLGDVVFEPNEYPIIRGGWSDRNDIFYSETPLDGLSSININVEGFTPRKNVSNR